MQPGLVLPITTVIGVLNKEKGLDAVRQKLRYEHFEDKRQLKTRAIENVLLSC